MQPHTGGDDKGNFQKIGEGLGGLMGQAADTLAGAMGSMLSGMGGWWSQTLSQQGSSGFSASFGADRDAQCRQHFNAQARAGGVRSYDEARPLYQFGHLAGQNPDYSGRSFDQVELDLERSWGQDQQRRFGAWPDVRGFVEFGYRGRTAPESGRSGTGGTSGGFGGTPPGGYQASGGGTAEGGFKASGEIKADTEGAGGGFKASGELKTDAEGTEGGFKASGGGSTDAGSGGFKASGELNREDR